ncbi:MAG: archaeal proteasome endopeptidase complex subunit alpha [Candidatus Marsarchaeota archaeon]|jgi:proteasome alpha subunit|uniref:Proteasome subunit alpha n=1 Tax=Candidatus Micrarchaeum acidiphilum ARMAN-2 TaxID=425595 RepID=C7DHZ8_MICA2|nr:MAG: Proteasome endopeptidase complex [Candidatus Micrarchaeum acidiphilum ARMAN-2]MCL5434745.1 archaeal proteasome endopeptidase complex subunit alpha [Candidatus Marsarchaeota archaeon]MCW6160819.1 archaeal proteasome endopeptidase complex subunit alpha [Candidatus Micrarchaeales archaeon]
MYPNIQAYDRGVMFSPDGRLFQVEYAKEAVRKGATSIGMVAEEGVVLLAHKNISEPLIIPSTVQKIFKVDSFIGATYSGLVSDGLHIVNLMRTKTQTHRMVYDETESVETMAREVSEEMQMATQYGGLRPYAISLILGGIDTEKRLFEVEPGASFSGYKADAIGVGKKIAEEMLVKDYKDSMSVEESIKLGVDILKKVNEKKLAPENVDISTIIEKKGYKPLSVKEIATYL